jgi:tetratricopeptide (TPR) repeat protein
MADIDQALRLDDKFADAYYYRGLIYLAQEEGQKAVNEFADAVRLNPYSFDSSLELGHALLMAKRPRDALRQLQGAEKLAETDAQFARLYYWRAMTNEALNSFRTAIESWQALLNLPPEAVPEEWITTAQEQIETLNATPTLSPTIRRSPTPTETPTARPSPSH